ncbi:uncharacterized protein DUF4837 [Roseivirga ehrenbergii]|uniref:DUF4837 domain-containing protein n=1 Tax=Roseivirga ehrenbergii (strain DSM 102268 / JCM 13514 / KCTC 12282 / NCIMB 14502 / KMM 6017) TaxID=279360 RepID=A0A150XT25_ROSEK|nr:DUF4837 family protein [Roseivirga ehrenbergii]KYG81844.1 hypothetical protein MB14_00155 [Roseivirga ehrenbergii]TCL01653.1 uncharacterized protein DUF4837 [Roseivirga ehrenbergii]
MKKLLFLAMILLSISSCGSKSEQEGEESKKMNPNLLPDATGQSGELVIVMNKEKWEGPLGEALKEVFHASVPGLSRTEPSFTTRVIEPFQYNRIFQLSRNVVYITTLDGTTPADKYLQGILPDSFKERIQNEPELFMNTSENQYAKGQKILNLFGKTDQDLINHLKENGAIIRNYFNMAERERLATDIRASVDSRAISDRIKDMFGYYIKIPVGFELATTSDDFMWSRFLPARGPSKNIFVYFKDYESQDEFTHENVIKLRNEVGRKYIYGDPENRESYMITETEFMRPVFRDITFDGKYTVEMRGAWKTNNYSVGGTFISYTFVDEKTNRLYYIEGFIIHPNEEHRELIRQMESILTTFRAVDNPPS